MSQLTFRLRSPQGDDWFRVLAETGTVAVFVYRDTFLYANAACEELFGYGFEELRRLAVEELIHPDSRMLLRHRAASTGAGERPRRCELKIIRRGGGEAWIDFAAAPIAHPDGPAMMATATDVSALKRQQLELQRSQQRLDLAQRAGRWITWEWMPASDELNLFEFSDRLLGFPARDLLRTGGDFEDLVHAEDRERLRRGLRNSLRGAGDLSLELRLLSTHGEILWLNLRAVAIRDETGWVERFVGVALDVTERKITERSLFQEKERAQASLASIADGVLRTDARGAVDYLNPAAQKLTGWTLAEAYGRPAREVYRAVADGSSNRPLEPVERCLTEGREIVSPENGVLVHRGGDESPIGHSAAPIRDREGDVIGAVLVFRRRASS